MDIGRVFPLIKEDGGTKKSPPPTSLDYQQNGKWYAEFFIKKVLHRQDIGRAWKWCMVGMGVPFA